MKRTNQDMQGDGKIVYQRLTVFDITSKFFVNLFSKSIKYHIFISNYFT